MLVTVTLNPALDISGTVDNLIPDEKSYVRDEIHTPGGNGINAAIIAHRLGPKVIATGLIGGTNGEEIKELLDRIKVRHAFIPIKGRTRMNLTVNNCDNHRQTRLSFPGPTISHSEREALAEYLQSLTGKNLVVFGGSLPPGMKPSFIAGMVKELKARGILSLVDMPGGVLKEVLKSGPLFIKPNLVEFQDLTDSKVESIKSILPLVRNMNDFVPLVCVSSVEGGAILVSKKSAFYGKIPKVKVLSTVGAGDSMVGAISSRLLKDPEASVDELLRWGLAAACATLTEKGMVLGSKKSITNYLSQIIIREIK